MIPKDKREQEAEEERMAIAAPTTSVVGRPSDALEQIKEKWEQPNGKRELNETFRKDWNKMFSEIRTLLEKERKNTMSCGNFIISLEKENSKKELALKDKTIKDCGDILFKQDARIRELEAHLDNKPLCCDRCKVVAELESRIAVQKGMLEDYQKENVEREKGKGDLKC